MKLLKLLSITVLLTIAVAIPQSADAATCQSASCDGTTNQVCVTFTNNTAAPQCHTIDYIRTVPGPCPVLGVQGCGCASQCGSYTQCTRCFIIGGVCAPAPTNSIIMKVDQCTGSGSCIANATCV